MATPISNHLEALPAWARDLSEKYYSQTLSMFVLHGNVRDLAPLKRGTSVEYVPLQRFLKDALFGARELVVFYDRGGGLSFGSPERKADFDRALSGYDSFPSTNFKPARPSH